MQFKQTLVRLTLILFPAACFSQTTYLSKDDKAYILLERLEIKAQSDSVLNFSKTKPFSRKTDIPVLEKYFTAGQLVHSAGEIPVTADERTRMIDEVGASLSKVDLYNAQQVLMGNAEWTGLRFSSKKPIAKRFYTSPANLYEVHVKDFDLIINPLIRFSVSKERNNDQRLFLNSRGLYVRGKIANKIGFYATVSDNQERDPLYVQQWINKWKAVPGEGFYKTFKAAGGVDYFDAQGYFTFNVAKYINVQFGYDRNFIGNGYRSLFLSDYGSPYLFLKLNTRIWKINYQNLFMELAASDTVIGDHVGIKKYAAMHHLDVDVTKWLNIGLFEGITFGRKGHFDFGYLNPIIFYRAAEQQNGSYDKSHAGLDIKANVAKRFQFYGQFFLDEFVLKEIKANRGFWANKWGIQMGAKYIDAFNIKNLDLQVEANRVRPFTYSHGDSIGDYSHYNQPLAHPLGANFKEFIGIARYQPAPKWLVEAKLIHYIQGRDSSSESYGSNIFLPYRPPYRTEDYGFFIGSGWKTDVTYASLLVSYELKENLFLEITGIIRKQETKTPPITSANTSIVSFGVRWNMQRREFAF
ncbi:MAG: hypothetical protein B6D37_03900 [Sphingobacteriales bacterium UTBCD1]|jgi:hypothetical protein|nr:MAG: hypothetical protein B6D37_03900 [Sphingobacteriales bacterium UTBCD1]